MGKLKLFNYREDARIDFFFSPTIHKDKFERKIKSGKNNKEMPFVFVDEHGLYIGQLAIQGITPVTRHLT